MGCNEHRDLERTEGLRRLLDEGALVADSRQEVLARYILNHGFAALSETQQQEFHDDLLPLLDLRDRSDHIQLFISKAVVGDAAFAAIADLDLGDHVRHRRHRRRRRRR